MRSVSSKLRRWAGKGRAGYSYWCQGYEQLHSIVTEGAGAWGFNGDIDRPVFTPSVLVRYVANPEASDEFKEWRTARVCHTFIGHSGAQPGQVIFLSDCTHALSGTVQLMPDLPDYLRGDQ